ncbi:hypothetical protein SESBI_17681 [Sesbania bispinosa]|nr:hypothetical protein SESBI_17681 [Sesbania bispinosa]
MVPETNKEEDELSVELEPNGIKSFQLAKQSILCKVMAPKPLNKSVVKSVLVKAWGDPKGVRISDLGVNTFLFSFNEKKEIKDVMERGPWYVMGHLISLQFWVLEASLFEIDFGSTSFWVQIHGLPLKLLSTTNAAKIIPKVGEVLEVENPIVEGKLLRTFIRVRARLRKTITHRPSKGEIRGSDVAAKMGGQNQDTTGLGRGDNNTEIPADSENMDRTLTPNNRKYQTQGNHTEQPQKTSMAVGQATSEGTNYFVEFPPEDEQDDKGEHNIQVCIQKQVESQLILGWNKSLSLKRNREDVTSQGHRKYKSFATYFWGCYITHGWGGGPYHVPPPSMSWLAWNCRGMRAAPTIRELKDLCRVYKPTLLFLSETRASDSKSEKVGLRPQNTGGINLFRQFLNDTDLMDMDLKGCKITWNSNMCHGFITKERLDMVLVNWPWRALFPNALALALPIVSSYHFPIIFWPKPQLSSGQTFKYEAFWNEHEDCEQVVRDGWQGSTQEEDPWKKYNNRLRSASSDWVEGQDDISNMILQHFQQIYKSDHPTISQDCVNVIPRIVTDEMDEGFLKPVSEEEIKRVVDSLGPLKAPRLDGLNGQFFSKTLGNS